MILVIPSLDIVVARAGKSWKRDWAEHYDVLEPFFQPIVDSVSVPAENSNGSARPPIGKTQFVSAGISPSQSVIERIEWAPVATIIRKAKGSDNWPITWGDDDNLYTAYGDGWGFEPKVKRKLSLGFAKISGSPDSFQGINIRSPSGERTGGGSSGAKASGMLMVDGVLTMWARNTGNSQPVWSRDRGRTWTWADWKFKTSFGAPTFLNFGRNYTGAIDEFVYVYSFDSDSAYRPSDRMVMARVAKDQITRRDAYEFFVRLDEAGKPIWSRDIQQRGAVFEDRGQCYRSGVSYNAGLKRFIWAQVKGGPDTRFEGGLGIYESANPWGPWREVFYTKKWDVGPGESASFPTKWISSDGKTMHLVFSGNDAFSMRRATIITK